MVMEKVNIGTIAQHCGYETTSSFISAFKNVFGMNPRAATPSEHFEVLKEKVNKKFKEIYLKNRRVNNC